MKKIHIILLVLLISSFTFLKLGYSEKGKIQYTKEQKKAIQDIEDIKALREEVRNDERFYKLNGSAPYLEPDKYEEFLAIIEDVEKNVIPEVNSKLEKWVKVYGSTKDEQIASYKNIFAEIEGGNVTHRNWFRDFEGFSYNYADIQERLANVAKTREASVKDLLHDINNDLKGIDAVLPDYRAPIYEKALKAVEVVFLFDPDNKEAKDLIKTIKKQGKSALKERENKIDAGEWPGQFKNFAGPGSVSKLSKAALEWFKNDEKGWAEATPLAVAVKGDWVSAKKNILGETTQWGLPIYLAAHKQKDTDIVRVFSLTILTKNEKGVDKEPPFTGAWVGNNFDMRIGKLPGSSGTKGPFFLWRLMLALSLIALGAAAASGKSAETELKPNKLAFYKGHLGVCASLLGTLFFIGNLMHLAPFSDILPQLFAIAAGIISGAAMYEKQTKEMYSPRIISGLMPKINSLFVKNKEKLEKLKAFERPIGLVCLALGILHLIAGGMTFF